jgi:hypothetical protein
MFIAIFSLTLLGGSLGLFLGYAARRLEPPRVSWRPFGLSTGR